MKFQLQVFRALTYDKSITIDSKGNSKGFVLYFVASNLRRISRRTISLDV